MTLVENLAKNYGTMTNNTKKVVGNMKMSTLARMQEHHLRRNFIHLSNNDKQMTVKKFLNTYSNPNRR